MNEYYKIEDVCKVKGGKRIPQGCTLQETPNEHPYIRILDMYQGRILNISEEMQYAKDDYWNIIKNYIVKKGDVILAIVGNTLGMVSIIGDTLDKANLTENCCKFDELDTDKVRKLFLYYSLVAPLNQKNIEKFKVGSSQPKLPIYNINQLLIPRWSVKVQDKITGVLSAIDSKIEINIQIMAELESMAKTIYDYWFLQFEFPNEDGKPYKSSGGEMVWNEELKREIPEGWECVQLGEIFSFVKGKIPESLSDIQEEGLHPYITIDVANNEKAEFCSGENMIYCNGEVIMVMDGAASGDVYIGNKGILGSTFAMMKKKRNDISDALIYLILKRQSVIYKKANTGSTVPHANRRFIENIKIPISRDMINLSRVFDETCEKIIQNRRENQELISLRDFLLPLLMNGQVGFKK